MPATPIANPEPGESIVGIDPQLLQQLNAGWRHRLNLFTGRALTENALDDEQQYRSGLLATLGQTVAPGIVTGLELSLDSSSDPLVTVTPGYGVAASGEDIILLRAIQTRLSTLAAFDPATGSQIVDPKTALPGTFQSYAAGANAQPAGVFVLQPIVTQVNGQAFDDKTGSIEVSGNLNASCDRDPEEYAFEDWQLADGARLVFVAWPAANAGLPLPAATPPATFRNRIVYSIFEAEAQLAIDDQLPWAAAGVPLALVAFDNSATTWQPLFVDRSAVVRPGGLPRKRRVLPVESPLEAIVQQPLAAARISQLSEQLSEQLALQPAFNDLGSIATQLPPAGVLPSAAMDFVNRVNLWLPKTWHVSAGPVHLEELEAALQTGMLTAPLDPQAAEDVEVLVPLPDALYDPDILVTETVAPDFQHELDVATLERDSALRTRKSVQLELNVLQTVLGPNAPQPNPNLTDLTAGLTPGEAAARDGLPAFWPQPSADPNLDRAFGTHGPATWQSVTPYVVGQLVVDPNGNFQKVTTAGSSGSAVPQWNATPGQTTSDGSVAWLNAGNGQWMPATAYVAGEFIVDANGNVQTVQTPGTSGASQYVWKPNVGDVTTDGTAAWRNAGPRAWQANFAFVAGQAVVDSNGNVQTAQNAGTSTASSPAWGDALEEITPDGAVQWVNHGPPTLWARGVAYRAGQFFVDSNGNVQALDRAGTSGATQLIWNATVGGTTSNDGTVAWLNAAAGVWQANTAYAVGQFVVDSNGNLQTVTVPGNSGATAPAWNALAGGTTTDGAVTWMAQVWTSIDLQTLETVASRAPYTVSWPAWQANTNFAIGQIVTDSNGSLQVVQTAGTSGATAPAWSTAAATATPDGSVNWSLLAGSRSQIPLIDADDWDDLANFGLQHFIDRLNAKIKRANDLIDLAFLTTQTDIYRFRQNVLGATDASRLATSPILANIATGVTASATAQNLKDYFASIQTSTPAGGGPASIGGAAGISEGFAGERAVSIQPSFASSSRVTSNIAFQQQSAAAAAASTPASASALAGAQKVTIVPTASSSAFSAVQASAVQTSAPRPIFFDTGEDVPRFTPISSEFRPAVSPEPATSEVTAQSPIVGAQLDIRTITVAERLAQSPSQESLFYAVGNRIGFMQILLELEITIDDLQLLVDAAETTAPPANAPIPTESHFFAEWRDTVTRSTVFNRIQTPFVMTNSDEAGLFSSGVRVLEQHTQLLRLLEARVQTYVDFVNLCTTAIGNVRNGVQRAQSTLSQLENQLAQARQDVAFTTSLLADEQLRVNDVNDRRRQILATSVQVVVYTRPRTLEIEDNVPSRQLVPGNIVSPVPTCLQQAIAVPPELSEIVALLHEVPVTWLPSVSALVSSLRRPILLQQIAFGTRARASLQLSMPQVASSALLAPSVYGPAIASIYQANQQAVRSFQTMRTSIVPESLAGLSWSSQVSAVSAVTTIADLASSQTVNAETASAVSRIQQQISSVAGCLYARANSALPVDRLAWAEFLRGPGLTIRLQNLAVLPNWNAQPYADRQQMQLLVDWLFAQIDGANPDALAYMSDVTRVCILLASHAPVNDVIAGAVTLRTQPSVGNTVTLNLPSTRVAAGMYVQLFSKGNLAAEAVVSDLDHTSVSATVTAVHTPGAFLEANDVAHFTTQRPQAVAMRAFTV